MTSQRQDKRGRGRPKSVSPLRPELGAYLRKIRNQRGLTLADVAQKAGGDFSEAYLSRVERGERTNISPQYLTILFSVYMPTVEEYAEIIWLAGWSQPELFIRMREGDPEAASRYPRLKDAEYTFRGYPLLRDRHEASEREFLERYEMRKVAADRKFCRFIEIVCPDPRDEKERNSWWELWTSLSPKGWQLFIAALEAGELRELEARD